MAEPASKTGTRQANLQIPEFEDFVTFLKDTAQAKPKAPAAPAESAQAAPAAAEPPKAEAAPAPSARQAAAPARETKPAAPSAKPASGRAPRVAARRAQAPADIKAREIAQNSYKRKFDETRDDLVQRLLDPTLSLEEAARLLDVCPTTVRRYTNRGILSCYRTAGNQRRFRLSEVIAFMRAQAPGAEGADQQEQGEQPAPDNSR